MRGKQQTPCVNSPDSQDGIAMCCFCQSCDVNEVDLGELITKGSVTVHYFCLLFSSGLSQNCKPSDKQAIRGFLPQDILKEQKRGSRLRCCFCHKKGATVGCAIASCRKAFHLPCGRKRGTLHQFFKSFSSFCVQHRPSQSGLGNDPHLSSSLPHLDEKTCAICLCGLDSSLSFNTLSSPCCSNSLFHRHCIQRHAMSAGKYFFRCPLCNSFNDFQNEMLNCGIYIPDQDASWERQPDAYSSLLERHSTCDALHCRCPQGRNHDDEKWPFDLKLCQWCGSFGSHQACRGLTRVGVSLLCPVCADIAHSDDGGQASNERFSSQDDEDGESVFPSEAHPRLNDGGCKSSSLSQLLHGVENCASQFDDEDIDVDVENDEKDEDTRIRDIGQTMPQGSQSLMNRDVCGLDLRNKQTRSMAEGLPVPLVVISRVDSLFPITHGRVHLKKLPGWRYDYDAGSLVKKRLYVKRGLHRNNVKKGLLCSSSGSDTRVKLTSRKKTMSMKSTLSMKGIFDKNSGMKRSLCFKRAVNGKLTTGKKPQHSKNKCGFNERTDFEMKKLLLKSKLLNTTGCRTKKSHKSFINFVHQKTQKGKDLQRTKGTALGNLKVDCGNSKGTALGNLKVDCGNSKGTAFGKLKVDCGNSNSKGTALGNLKVDCGNSKGTALGKLKVDCGNSKGTAFGKLKVDCGNSKGTALGKLKVDCGNSKGTALGKLKVDCGNSKGTALGKVKVDCGNSKGTAFGKLKVNCGNSKGTAFGKLKVDCGNSKGTAFGKLKVDCGNSKGTAFGKLKVDCGNSKGTTTKARKEGRQTQGSATQMKLDMMWKRLSVKTTENVKENNDDIKTMGSARTSNLESDQLFQATCITQSKVRMTVMTPQLDLEYNGNVPSGYMVMNVRAQDSTRQARKDNFEKSDLDIGDGQLFQSSASIAEKNHTQSESCVSDSSGGDSTVLIRPEQLSETSDRPPLEPKYMMADSRLQPANLKESWSEDFDLNWAAFYDGASQDKGSHQTSPPKDKLKGPANASTADVINNTRTRMSECSDSSKADVFNNTGFPQCSDSSKADVLNNIRMSECSDSSKADVLNNIRMSECSDSSKADVLNNIRMSECSDSSKADVLNNIRMSECSDSSKADVLNNIRMSECSDSSKADVLNSIRMSECSDSSKADVLNNIRMSECSDSSKADVLNNIRMSECSDSSKADVLNNIRMSECSDSSKADVLNNIRMSECSDSSKADVINNIRISECSDSSKADVINNTGISECSDSSKADVLNNIRISECSDSSKADVINNTGISECSDSSKADVLNNTRISECSDSSKADVINNTRISECSDSSKADVLNNTRISECSDSSKADVINNTRISECSDSSKADVINNIRISECSDSSKADVLNNTRISECSDSSKADVINNTRISECSDSSKADVLNNIRMSECSDSSKADVINNTRISKCSDSSKADVINNIRISECSDSSKADVINNTRISECSDSSKADVLNNIRMSECSDSSKADVINNIRMSECSDSSKANVLNNIRMSECSDSSKADVINNSGISECSDSSKADVLNSTGISECSDSSKADVLNNTRISECSDSSKADVINNTRISECSDSSKADVINNTGISECSDSSKADVINNTGISECSDSSKADVLNSTEMSESSDSSKPAVLKSIHKLKRSCSSKTEVLDKIIEKHEICHSLKTKRGTNNVGQPEICDSSKTEQLDNLNMSKGGDSPNAEVLKIGRSESCHSDSHQLEIPIKSKEKPKTLDSPKGKKLKRTPEMIDPLKVKRSVHLKKKEISVSSNPESNRNSENQKTNVSIEQQTFGNSDSRKAKNSKSSRKPVPSHVLKGKGKEESFNSECLKMPGSCCSTKSKLALSERVRQSEKSNSNTPNSCKVNDSELTQVFECESSSSSKPGAQHVSEIPAPSHSQGLGGGRSPCSLDKESDRSCKSSSTDEPGRNERVNFNSGSDQSNCLLSCGNSSNHKPAPSPLSPGVNGSNHKPAPSPSPPGVNGSNNRPTPSPLTQRKRENLQSLSLSECRENNLPPKKSKTNKSVKVPGVSSFVQSKLSSFLQMKNNKF